MRIIFGLLAIYLWLGIIFATIILLWLRNTHNQADYKVICQHPLQLVLRWPDLALKMFIVFMAYRKLQYFKKLCAEDEAKKKNEYISTIHDKTKSIDDRLNALVELGAVDYSYDKDNKK